jgi:hypothetical protein
MGRFVFSIPPAFVVLKPAAAEADAVSTQAPATATVQWETADGKPTGAPIELRLPDPVVLEYPGPRGEIARANAPNSLTFFDDPPQDGVSLRLSVAGSPPVSIERDAITEQPPALPVPEMEPVGPPGAKFVVPVFSERFVSKDDFLQRVRELHEWIVGHPPFDREPTKSQIGLLAHFWSSDANSGLFGTSDHQIQFERLFHGNLDLAKTLLQPWMGAATVSLILINSTKRGGAGGQPGSPAWTSITSAIGEEWENVCLHEIGHGLGLADEYLDDRLATNEVPMTLEPNVSRSSIPSEAPWGTFVTLPDAPAPSSTLDEQKHVFKNGIGTFEGARYRTDLYRPTMNCLMKETTQSFCIVCQRHIEKVLSGPPIV